MAILRPSWILPGTTQLSRHQKGKTNVDLLEQEIVSSSGISWVICKCAPQLYDSMLIYKRIGCTVSQNSPNL